MTTIHLVGSDGFIGKAIQREAADLSLHCWSHMQVARDHYFDLLDSSSWQSLLDCKPTHVILLSWPGLPNYQELFHVSRNLPACVELIEQLVDVGLKRLVVSGTCYEYGLQNGQLKEEQFTDPVNCYAIAKDCLRRVISSRYCSNDLQWCWARIFYPYGQGQNSKSLHPSLLKALKAGEEFFPMGSGRQLRDFVDVREVARQLLMLSVHEYAGGVYNIGSGNAVSVIEMAEKIITTYGGKIKLKKGVLPDRSDEPLAFWADIGKFKFLQELSRLRK